VADLKQADLSQLDNHLSQNSYIVHHQPTQADAEMHKYVKTVAYKNWPNIVRWMNHIESFGEEAKSFPSQVDSLELLGCVASRFAYLQHVSLFYFQHETLPLFLFCFVEFNLFIIG